MVFAALLFSEVTEQREHNIADEPAGQVVVLDSGVEQWALQHNDVDAHLLSDALPVFDDFIVISSKSVELFDENAVAGLDPFQQLLIILPVEILAGLLVHQDIAAGNALFEQGDDLPVFLLVASGYAGVAVAFSGRRWVRGQG